MPRLSVIMPAFNAESTIRAALQSTLRDMPRDSELVVLDDGSTDATAETAAATGDGRVRVISRPNRGVARTLNDLLDATDSELVARMDADDVVLPGRFRRQLRAMDDADAVFTTVVGWGTGRPTLPRPAGISPEEFGLHLLLTNPVAHSTLLARRRAIAAAGAYRELPTEDYDLWLRMARGGARLRRTALPGLAYRTHAGQVTASAQWRRSSWLDPELAEAYAQLAEQLTGARAARITSLSIDDSLDAAEKRQRLDEFSARFEQAAVRLPRASRRRLRRKLEERRAWFAARLAPADQVPA